MDERNIVLEELDLELEIVTLFDADDINASVSALCGLGCAGSITT